MSTAPFPGRLIRRPAWRFPPDQARPTVDGRPYTEPVADPGHLLPGADRFGAPFLYHAGTGRALGGPPDPVTADAQWDSDGIVPVYRPAPVPWAAAGRLLRPPRAVVVASEAVFSSATAGELYAGFAAAAAEKGAAVLVVKTGFIRSTLCDWAPPAVQSSGLGPVDPATWYAGELLFVHVASSKYFGHIAVNGPTETAALVAAGWEAHPITSLGLADQSLCIDRPSIALGRGQAALMHARCGRFAGVTLGNSTPPENDDPAFPRWAEIEAAYAPATLVGEITDGLPYTRSLAAGLEVPAAAGPLVAAAIAAFWP